MHEITNRNAQLSLSPAENMNVPTRNQHLLKVALGNFSKLTISDAFLIHIAIEKIDFYRVIS